MKLLPLKKKFSKTIIFEPYHENVEAVESLPQPISNLMPAWYKKLPRFVNNSDKPIKAHGHKDVKLCVPFRDVMMAGYVYVTLADIEVISYENGDVDVFWNKEFPFKPVDKRGSVLNSENQGYGMPVPSGCNPTLFAFSPSYGAKLPPKYSILVTHPFNRHDLPFVTTSALVDPIGLGSKSGNYPFFFKEGFSGVIPKGTPYAQIIPIKQENWFHKIITADYKDYAKRLTLRDSYFYGQYANAVSKNRANRTYK